MSLISDLGLQPFRMFRFQDCRMMANLLFNDPLGGREGGEFGVELGKISNLTLNAPAPYI